MSLLMYAKAVPTHVTPHSKQGDKQHDVNWTHEFQDKLATAPLALFCNPFSRIKEPAGIRKPRLAAHPQIPASRVP
ncbi:MAG: hypothetical protein EOO27_00420 [Comamonadaceae bacterium]|nr:MAG: hypothetical protein EOO27_00420 [Comamonadaceae bacterium]